MISFPKLGTERNSEWRCCLCLHVRTGVILLGSWHLLLQLLACGMLAANVRNPHFMTELARDTNSVQGDWSVQALPSPLPNIETRPSSFPQTSQPKEFTLVYHDVDMGALVTVCTLAITIMLVYGASRGKPAHLLPFFCLQIFDFAISVLTATGFLCYPRSIHDLISESKRVPWRDELLSLPKPALAFTVLLGFLVAILIKGYWISVVWRCYKYMTMRAHAMHSLTPFVISNENLMTAPPYNAAPPATVVPDYSTLLPDYEEAVKQTPPPSYRAATLMTNADPEAGHPTTGPTSVPTADGHTVPPQTVPAPVAQTVVMLPHQGEQARV